MRRIWARSEVRYLVAGGFAFLFDIGLLWLAHDVFRVPLPIATPIAFLGSFVVTYTLQRIVAFESEAKVVGSVGRYAALVLANTLATTGIVLAIETLTGSWLAGKIVAVIATTVWNYFIYRYWVFATPKVETEGTDV